jgi:glycosyltransferase involved in cell wall biosynthesis
MSSPAMRASIVISTKDRKGELRRALASCVRQDPPVEVVIIDDGSTDGTSKMVTVEFPHVRLFRSEVSKGQAFQRNQGAKFASGQVIVSLDDDAEFSSSQVVHQTLAAFDHPRIGAVTIPWRNVPGQLGFTDQAPDLNNIYVCMSFTGLGHAIRRDLFLALSGYRDYLLGGSEEVDFCVRLLDAGYVVRLGHADHVNHYESKVRNIPRQAYRAARNAILFAWYYAPRFVLPVHALGSATHTLVYGSKHGFWAARVKGVVAGFGGWLPQWKARSPLSWQCYCLYRRLMRSHPLRLEEIETKLRPAQNA